MWLRLLYSLLLAVSLLCGGGAAKAQLGCGGGCGTSSGTGSSGLAIGTIIDVSTQSSVAAALATGGNLYFPSGNWSLTGSAHVSTTAQTLWFAPGAMLSCPGGLQIKGPIVAPRTRIFSSTCAPNLSGNIGLSEGAYPEWWGAAADTNATTGNGTDNLPFFQAAYNSNVSKLSLGFGSYRMSGGFTGTHGSFKLSGQSDGATQIWIDDTTHTADGFFFSGGASGLTIENVGLYRIQAGYGSCAWAYPYTPGTGWTPGDTVVLSGGTLAPSASACSLSVTTTEVVSASLTSGGSGGANGSCVVQGTTGTGTKFQGTGTVVGGVLTGFLISSYGAYTINPTTLTAEPLTPVTGCAGLTGAVASVAMGAQTTAIANGGSYVAPTIGDITATSTSGTGINATFHVAYSGPADLHIEDWSRVHIRNNQFGTQFTWNSITMDSNLSTANKIYIDGDNIFNDAENDGIFMYGSPTIFINDVFIDNPYMTSMGNSAIQIWQYAQEINITNANIYSVPYAINADVGVLPLNTSINIGALRVRLTKEDSLTLGSFWRGVGASEYQSNWHGGLGTWQCVVCGDVVANGNHFISTGSGITLLGSNAISMNDNTYDLTTTTAITIGPYGLTQTTDVSAVASTVVNGSGVFLTALPNQNGLAPSDMTYSVLGEFKGLTTVVGSITNLQNLGTNY